MVKMKYKLLIIIGVVFFIFISSFLIIRNSRNSRKPKSFSYFIGTKGPNISKIFMRNGSDGKYVSTTDKTKIKELLTLLNNTQYIKAADQIGANGFSYSYIFYVGNRSVLEIVDRGSVISGSVISINGKRYNVIKGYKNGVKNWYNSLLE